MRIALYARVSTGEQTPAPQLDALRAYASARGLEAREFVDHGESGRKDRRPQLDALRAAVRRREVDAVACVKLDRLARSVRHLCELAAELEALGVALVVLDQAIDTSTPAGRFTFHVLAAVGELEVEMIRERTRAGLRSAVRRGVKLGRPAALDREGVARARRLAESGRSVREVATLLGVSLGTAHAAMRK